MELARVQICPICDNHSYPSIMKGEIEYFQCYSCKTLFCGELDNSGKVGGEFEIERNERQNQERIKRLLELTKGHTLGIKVLDFGAGHGLFVKELYKAGYIADGFDKFNPAFDSLVGKANYNLVVMTEVIEHLSSPFIELNAIHQIMRSGGIVVIETSFIDIARDDGIPLVDFFYINPDVGHSTIFSHHSLDILMCLKGFKPIQHFNRNTRCYAKP